MERASRSRSAVAASARNARETTACDRRAVVAAMPMIVPLANSNSPSRATSRSNFQRATPVDTATISPPIAPPIAPKRAPAGMGATDAHTVVSSGAVMANW